MDAALFDEEVQQEEMATPLQQVWNPAFVVFAYLIACFSAYSAVHLLDHHLWFWRSDQLKNSAIVKHPDLCAAVMLAVGTVWCMHFVGMAAVTLEATPICYNWGVTMGSLGAVVLLMIAGIKVAGKDIFATPQRDQVLDHVLRGRMFGEMDEQAQKYRRFWIMATHKLHFIVAGSFLAASGAVTMHYTGMMAQRGPFHKEWNYWYIGASILTAIVICFVGFWIIFRLRWKIEQVWLRYASAAIIAAAVCGLHFFGMVGVTYYPDQDIDNRFAACEAHMASPNEWTKHQVTVFALGLAVLVLNFLLESAINQELLIAYESAAQSSEIVASLFPEQVRDRLLVGGKKKHAQKFFTGDVSSAFIEVHGEDDDPEAPKKKHHSDLDLFDSEPIAELFPSTTIMFMDLAGFTKWSSKREPGQVFLLLESLYQAFDRQAKKRDVFKIETIGDCYVAATGLPKPQPDHAVIMVKFARDCQLYMRRIIHGRLVDRLGEDTKDLQFRVGMHSGPTTGGVLRGQKARFQLFGDTMNTASRMETCGLPGRIHVSEETATELRNNGMGHWLTPREDLVEAKGKGLMQTYFVSVEEDHEGSCISSHILEQRLNSSIQNAGGHIRASPDVSAKGSNDDTWEEDE